MQSDWDEEQLTLFEELVTSLGLDALWTPSIPSDEPGPTPIEEQIDFDEIWAEKLRNKYGIAKPFAD